MKNKKLMSLSLILLTLILVYVGTYAYYMRVVNGKITAKTGKFTFDVYHNNETFTSINLYDTAENPSLANRNIIPGDSGKFELVALATGSATDIEYEINFDATNVPTNMNFYLNEQKTNKINFEKGLKGYFNYDDENKRKTYTIYWEWPFDSDNDDDINYQGKVLSLDVNITGKQSPYHAIMMNGDLYEHSNKATTVGMWKTEYRGIIKTVNFSNDLSILPTECTEANLCWDITDTESAYPVYNYLKANETDSTLYDSYVVSKEKIYAPRDSSGIFALYTLSGGLASSNLELINFNGNFDTSKVTNMCAMFFALKELKSIDVSNFVTVNVTNMSQLFYLCATLPELDVSSFDTSKVTDMSYMFNNLQAIENLDLRNLDTSNVTNMQAMISRCINLTNINLSSFNTSKVTNMLAMFQASFKLTSLDLRSFDTSSVTNMQAMFGGIDATGNMYLKEIKVSDKFVTTNVTNMLELFRFCAYLKFTINITGNNVTNYSKMFLGAAIDPSSLITVNYTAETEALVDNMIATAGSGNHVVKGSLIS